MCEFCRERHIVQRLVCRIPVHDTLVSRALFGTVDCPCNIRTLFVNPHFEFQVVRIVSHLCNDRLCDILVVNLCIGSYFSADKAFVVRQHNLYRYTAVGILFQAFVQNAVRNKVCQFIGMSARYRFRSVDSFCHDVILQYHFPPKGFIYRHFCLFFHLKTPVKIMDGLSVRLECYGAVFIPLQKQCPQFGVILPQSAELIDSLVMAKPTPAPQRCRIERTQ